MHQVLKMTIKTLAGNKPFTVADWKALSGNTYNALFDTNNRFMGIVTLTGNSKQRRQQRRALIKELNQ